eukprot:TRINITY_DN2712_c1_g1_i1.p2 TRINITY_DN2712_c1_g1~~TRINITY_DN2712_c1_g1_i1.p2  ORF type:complete len:166 (+),score=32.13 TRINITY_DN2712_c1_g1_i1:280-777(+)
MTPETKPPPSGNDISAAKPAPPTSTPPPFVGGGGIYGLGPPPAQNGTVTLGELVALSTATHSPARAYPPSKKSATLPNGGLVLVALAAGSVDRVEFMVNGRKVATERVYPYALGGAGATGGPLTAWGGAPRGTFTLQVIVFGKWGHVVSASWRLWSSGRALTGGA